MDVYELFRRVKPSDNERRWRMYEHHECLLVTGTYKSVKQIWTDILSKPMTMTMTSVVRVRSRAYFNCLTTGTNVPVVPGFVPVVLMFCPSCPDQNFAIQWLKYVGQMINI